MKAIYLVTHGKRHYGVNPSHTPEGIRQIEKLFPPKDGPLVVIGTGIRFREIYTTMINQGHLRNNIRVNYSPFCGSADGLEPNKDIILVDGTTVSLEDYISIGSDCFDAWRFISDLPNGALLCAGGELMAALGLKYISEYGQLYELDPENETGKKISI